MDLFDTKLKRGTCLALTFLLLVVAGLTLDRHAEGQLDNELQRQVDLLHERLQGFEADQSPDQVAAGLRGLGIDPGPISVRSTDVAFAVEEHSLWRYGCITVVVREEGNVDVAADSGRC